MQTSVTKQKETLSLLQLCKPVGRETSVPSERTAAQRFLRAPNEPAEQTLPLNARMCRQVSADDEALHRKVWGQPKLQSKLHDYIIQHSRVQNVLRELRDETMHLSNSVMATTIDQLPVLSMLAKLVDSKCILDIGTYTGISALLFALSMENGRVITIDMSDEQLPLAEKYWSRAGVSDQIEARVGIGSAVLEDLEREGYSKKVDLAFIDADKLGYDRYYEKLLKLVRVGGLIVMDNVLNFAQVADKTAVDEVTCSMRALNKKLFKDERIQFTLIPAADGLAVCQVKATNA